MKFLFVQPKNKLSFFGSKGYCPTYPHLGIAYLTAVLQKKGVEVVIFDDGAGYTRAKLSGLIRSFKPDMIGVTLYSFSTVYSYNLIDYLKKRFKIPVVLGGAHITSIRSDILRETKADFAVKYEAEYALPELLDEFGKENPDYGKVKNLIYRKGRKIIENPDRELDNRLDEIPYPQFDLFEMQVHQGHKEKIVPLITSRGCPYGCNYCSVKLYMGRGFRKRSTKNVVGEIMYQYNKGYHQFDFNDDCFLTDKKRANEILDLIIASGIKISFQFMNGLRVDTVDKRILKKLKKAGCFYISYGCESGNQDTLNKIKKGITLEQVRKATMMTREAGIVCSVNMIIGHRDETYEKAMDSVRFAKSLPTNYVNFYNLIPYQGTEAYDWVTKNGRFLVDTNNYLKEISYGNNRPIFETDEFSKEDRAKVLKIGSSFHERKVFQYRFGKVLGLGIYLATRSESLKGLAGGFVTANPVGRGMAFFLSRKSYKKD